MIVDKIVRLRDGEEVRAIIRNHWVTRVPQACVAFLLVAGPFFFMLPLFAAGSFGAVGFGASIIAGLYLAARQWFLWDWNAFVVTTHRVIDVDQRGWFSRTVSEAEFDRIEDASFTVHGVWGSVLGYGTLLIQTAGSTVTLELPCAADPKEAHHLISDAMAEQRRRGGGSAIAGSGAPSHRVSALLEAAAELDGPEARAFLTAVQQAAAKEPEKKEAPDARMFAPQRDDEEDV